MQAGPFVTNQLHEPRKQFSISLDKNEKGWTFDLYFAEDRALISAIVLCRVSPLTDWALSCWRWQPIYLICHVSGCFVNSPTKAKVRAQGKKKLVSYASRRIQPTSSGFIITVQANHANVHVWHLCDSVTRWRRPLHLLHWIERSWAAWTSHLACPFPFAFQSITSFQLVVAQHKQKQKKSCHVFTKTRSRRTNSAGHSEARPRWPHTHPCFCKWLQKSGKDGAA